MKVLYLNVLLCHFIPKFHANVCSWWSAEYLMNRGNVNVEINAHVAVL